MSKSSNDLVPRSMLPSKSVIPPGREFGAGAPAPKPRVPPTVKKKRSGGTIKKMRDGGTSAPAPRAPAPPMPRPSPSMLSKARGVVTGTAKRALGPVGNLLSLNDLYNFAKDAYDNARQYEQGGYGELPESPLKKGGKVKEKKIKKYQAGGMTIGGTPVGPGVNPNAPVQGGVGVPYMPPVGIAPGAIGGNPSNELPTVPVQPRQPMGRARPMPVPVRRPMPVRRRGMNEGGAVKKYAAGGSISSASRRADGIARKGKTRGKMC